MALSGQHFIGGDRQASGKRRFSAANPDTGETLPCEFADATSAEVDRAMQLADAAFNELQTVSWDAIAALIDAIADGLASAGQPLLDRVHSETALPMPRLESERARTIGQARLFAQMVRDGSWLQVRIDRGDPRRQPAPKPDVRTMLVGVGPVAVFGASNFPLAISVAGTDTIAAFAARCPVVVKAHPGHPGSCEMLGKIIAEAVASVGLPAGMFSLLQGASHDVGLALAEHPLTAAVAFTGSLAGGRALANAAAARPRPIPVYAEMGSVNPVFILPGAAEQNAGAIAESYIQAVALGVGQFCTNPGLVLGVAGRGMDDFLDAAAAAAARVPPAVMLHAGIHKAYLEGVERLAAIAGVRRLATSAADADANRRQAACTIFTANAELLHERPELREEVFGPASVVLRCTSAEEMYDAARGMDGSLAAAIHGTEHDLVQHAALVRILQRKVGRLVFNGFPTGIEVCAAMHHGGPYPATTHSYFTSIGQAAVYRFVRPVCYQSFPDAALPPELQEANPRGLHRLVDGVLRSTTASTARDSSLGT